MQREAQAADINAKELNDDDRLTYALFPQVAIKFFRHRHDPAFFEPIPSGEATAVASKSPAVAVSAASSGNTTSACYDVRVDGVAYRVEVAASGELSSIQPAPVSSSIVAAAPLPSTSAEAPFAAPLAGTIVKLVARPGQSVVEGDVLLIMETMKMEAEIRATHSAVLSRYQVREGDIVTYGETLAWLA